jgi:hypothetical protein
VASPTIPWLGPDIGDVLRSLPGTDIGGCGGRAHRLRVRPRRGALRSRRGGAGGGRRARGALPSGADGQRSSRLHRHARRLVERGAA